MYMAKEKTPDTVTSVMQPVPNDPIYDLHQAALILRCNERILAEKFRKGVIPGKKRLGKWFTTHSRLLEFINA